MPEAEARDRVVPGTLPVTDGSTAQAEHVAGITTIHDCFETRAASFFISESSANCFMTTAANNEQHLPESVTNPDQKPTPSQLVTALQREHPEWVTEVIEALGEVTAIVPREHIVDVCAS